MTRKYREMDFSALIAEIHSKVETSSDPSEARECAAAVVTMGIRQFLDESLVALDQLQSELGNANALISTREMTCLPISPN